LSPVLLESAKRSSISSGFNLILQINFFKSIRERDLRIFAIMEENWIRINKYMLFLNWLILRNCNLVKKLDLFFRNQSNLPKISKRRFFKLI